MSSNLKRIDYNGWAGGLNALADKSAVQKDQLVEARNVLIRDNGEIASRPGTLNIIEAPTATSPNKYYSMWNDYRDIYCYHFSNKTLRSDTVLLHTYANDNRGMFEQFNNTLLHANGIDIMQQWDGAAATTSDVVGSPTCQILLRHNDRIFAAAGSVVYETTVNTAIDFAGGAAWNIGLGEGGIITGLASIGMDLFIFKKDRIYIMTGYSKSERQTRLLTKDVGTIEPYTLQTVTLKGMGEVILFFSTNKKICALSLSGWANIGEAVQPLLDAITLYNPPEGTYFLTKCQAIINESARQYMLAFYYPDGTTPAGVRNMCLCLHLDSPYKSVFGTRWGFTKYYNSNGSTFSYQVTYEAMCKSVNYGVLFASYDLIYTLPADQRILRFTGVSDNGKNIPIIIRTRDEDAGNHSAMKHWRRALIRMSLSKVTAQTSLANFSEYTDETTLAINSLSQTFTPTSATTYGNVIEHWIDLVNSAKTCSLQLDFTVDFAISTDNGFRIPQITIFYKPNQVENRK